MANRTRTRRMVLDVSEEEYEAITANMEKAGITSFSAYARTILLKGYVIKPDYTEIKNLTAAVNRIGNNINQIARVMNASNQVKSGDVEAVKKEQQELWLVLKSMLSKLR